jgi:hypothetical protein
MIHNNCIYLWNFFLIIIHLTNVSLALFDPIRPQDCIIADQSSALLALACDLCGESEMIDEHGRKKWREGDFGGAMKGLMLIHLISTSR